VSLYEKVTAALTDAMRARDAARVLALRNIRAGYIAEMKTDNSSSLDDARCTAVLRRLAKQRVESIEAYTQAKRNDLAEPERAELAIIESFLPPRASAEAIESWVTEAIAATGAQTVKDIGRVMGAVMKAHAGTDAAAVRAAAERLLAPS
jgi:uncharacterized protein YqeY